MFEQFFLSVQQDIKLFIFFPVLCAIFRAIFIKVYSPYESLKGKGKVVWHCFRYGFWWGMDINANVFLFSLVLITLPGLFFTSYMQHGDAVRIGAGIIYGLILYAAFMGKMIFYYHFHDIYNLTLKLGAHAEKHNLVDIFFHQHHGLWILLGMIPYALVCGYGIHLFLSVPSLPYPQFASSWLHYAFNTLVVLVLIAGYYFFRYGGTFLHDNKPEWDTIPSVVKNDIFFSKATVDDLVALKMVKKQKVDDVYMHSDAEDLAAIQKVALQPEIPVTKYPNPVYAFKRTAKGAWIHKPSHIFLLVGESYLHLLFEKEFACLNLTSGGKALMNDPHTASLPNFLSAGLISRPSIVSLMSGIFDARLELNEKEAFWQGTVPTALPLQLKKLGYTSTYWYGGNASYGNFTKFAPACGFDHVMSAPEFCGPDAPKTWVGVYDNVFLEKAAELIQQQPAEQPQFHMLYTTSYHGPFKIPLAKYGYDTEKVMPNAPDVIKKSERLQKEFGTFWFSDQAIGKFIRTMREAYPDCLFIVTADHGINLDILTKPMLHRDTTFHDRRTPVFMMNHREIDQSILAGNTIGSHMHIMPTILELIAPKGFTYYSLFPSMTEKLDHVLTPYFWLNSTAIGPYDDHFYQPLGENIPATELREGKPLYQEEMEGYKDLTGYLLRHPEALQPWQNILHN